MQRLFVFVVLSVAVVGSNVRGGESGEQPRMQPGVRTLYDALSASMRTGDLRSFMKLFHINFVYEGEDEASLDRGPWRRVWLDRFPDRSYEVVTHRLKRVVKEAEARVTLQIESVLVYDEKDVGKRLEKVSFEDTLVRDGDTWSFLLRNRRSSLVGDVPVAPPIESPRLAALGADVETFWADIEKNGAPLVEPLVDTQDDAAVGPRQYRVTFLWRGGNGETDVRVTAPGAVEGKLLALRPLRDTGLWHRSVKLPSDARFRYEFHVRTAISTTTADAPSHTVAWTSVDPLNPHLVDELSVVRLPGAPSPNGGQKLDGEGGTLERETVRSRLLRERRFVSVYRPAGYKEDGAPYPAAFLLDGGSYESRRATRDVLDRLIDGKRIPPLVVFLLHSEGSRSPNLTPTSKFVDFLCGELVEWGHKSAHISSKPEDLTIGGSGLGATLATLAASRRPDVFGSVLAETGDFAACVDPVEGGDRDCLPQRFSAIPKQDLKFFLAVAELDDAPLVHSSWHLRDVLAAKGYTVSTLRLARNRHSTTWLEAMAAGLEELSGR